MENGQEFAVQNYTMSSTLNNIDIDSFKNATVRV